MLTASQPRSDTCAARASGRRTEAPPDRRRPGRPGSRCEAPANLLARPHAEPRTVRQPGDGALDLERLLERPVVVVEVVPDDAAGDGAEILARRMRRGVARRLPGPSHRSIRSRHRPRGSRRGARRRPPAAGPSSCRRRCSRCRRLRSGRRVPRRRRSRPIRRRRPGCPARAPRRMPSRSSGATGCSTNATSSSARRGTVASATWRDQPPFASTPSSAPSPTSSRASRTRATSVSGSRPTLTLNARKPSAGRGRVAVSQVVAVAAERDLGRYLVPERAAEQRGDGPPESVAESIPEGRVDAGLREPVAADDTVELDAVPLDGRERCADQAGCEDVTDEVGRRDVVLPAPGGRGADLTESLDALVGDDAHEDERRRVVDDAGAADTKRRLRVRSDDGRLDGRDRRPAAVRRQGRRPPRRQRASACTHASSAALPRSGDASSGRSVNPSSSSQRPGSATTTPRAADSRGAAR